MDTERIASGLHLTEFEGIYAMSLAGWKEESRSSDLVKLRVSYFAGEKRQRPNAVAVTSDLCGYTPPTL